MVVEVEVEELSYDEAFNKMWEDGENPVLDVEEPEIKEEVEEEEVVEEPTPEPEPEPEVPEPVKVATRDKYDWIKALPPEQQEMANALKHEALSDRGRVSALTRQNNEIKTELVQARSTVTPVQEEASVTSTPQPSENLKRLQEDYPELGKQLTDIWAEREASLEKRFSDQLAPIQEARTADAVASEQARLETEAADIFNTKETGTYWKDVVQSEDFSAWLNMQPAFIQNTARTSDNAQDGIDVLRMYESDYQVATAAQATPETPSNDANEDATLRGDKLKAERQQRKATTVSPGSKPVGTEADELAGDYEAQFNAMWGGKK